jgi:hypothetical protein
MWEIFWQSHVLSSGGDALRSVHYWIKEIFLPSDGGTMLLYQLAMHSKCTL